MRRARLSTASLVTALAAVSLVLAGCSGGSDDKDDDTGADPQAVAEGVKLDATWPLTGLPVKASESSSQKHPVMVLKMDNTYASSPQLGLGKADMVVEELVEGGSTRLAAFFYSQVPGDVGPVRSMRASDIGIVSPTDAVMVTSGAAARTIARIRNAGITFFEEGSAGFYRDDNRSAPYNLFTNLTDVATEVGQKEAARPADYLPWGSDADFPSGQKAREIAASFSGGHTTEWSYRGGSYVNDNTYAAKGDEFKADNVLVLRVKIGDAGYLDPAGNPVPETKLLGKGPAMLFHGGRLVRAQWEKDGYKGPITLTTKAGELTVPAGHTFIELVPTVDGDVTFTP